MTAKLDPISGPMPRREFNELVAAPFGEAKKRIRKYDPLFGREDGEKIKWKVTVQRDGRDEGHAYVDACTKEEADEASDLLSESDIDWDDFGAGFTVIDIEPATP